MSVNSNLSETARTGLRLLGSSMDKASRSAKDESDSMCEALAGMILVVRDGIVSIAKLTTWSKDWYGDDKEKRSAVLNAYCDLTGKPSSMFARATADMLSDSDDRNAYNAEVNRKRAKCVRAMETAITCGLFISKRDKDKSVVCGQSSGRWFVRFPAKWLGEDSDDTCKYAPGSRVNAKLAEKARAAIGIVKSTGNGTRNKGVVNISEALTSIDTAARAEGNVYQAAADTEQLQWLITLDGALSHVPLKNASAVEALQLEIADSIKRIKDKMAAVAKVKRNINATKAKAENAKTQNAPAPVTPQ